MNTCPQNVFIKGFSSKSFSVLFRSPVVKNSDDELKMVNALMPCFLSVFGNNFTVTIYSPFKDRISSYVSPTYMSITLSTFHWIYDVGKMVSELQTMLGNDYMTYVEINIDHNTNRHNYVQYNLVAKDGDYTEKQKVSTHCTILKRDCFGSVVDVPNYEIEIIDL